MRTESMGKKTSSLSRRSVLALGAGSVAAAVSGAPAARAGQAGGSGIVTPPEGKRILLSCKLGMIPKELDGKKLSAADRLRLAGEAGFDGVDFDQAGEFTPEQVREAVQESGVFVHNAINHAHWSQRLTSAKEEERARGRANIEHCIRVSHAEEERARGRANIEHCIRVSHAAGGSGVLIVVGRGGDGPTDVIEQRAREEIKKMLPLAASLGQMILIENVWNQMMYDHNAPPDQGAERFVAFVPARRVDSHLRAPLRQARRQGLQPRQEQVRRHHQRRRRSAVGPGAKGPRRHRLYRLGDGRGPRRQRRTPDPGAQADGKSLRPVTLCPPYPAAISSVKSSNR